MVISQYYIIPSSFNYILSRVRKMPCNFLLVYFERVKEKNKN